jgi:surface protein
MGSIKKLIFRWHRAILDCLLEGAAIFAPTAFITTWETTNTVGSVTPSNQVKLPFNSGGTYNTVVNWGDGSSNTITSFNQAEATHTYATPGAYTISMTGTMTEISFVGAHDKNKILSIESWGPAKLSTSIGGSQFRTCEFLNAPNCSDVLDTTGLTNIRQMFSDCIRLQSVGRMNEWNMSGITSIFSMFHMINAVSINGIGVFDQNLGAWDTSNMNTIQDAFRGCALFNNGGSPDIQNWNVGNVTNMIGTFEIANRFNQPLANWERSFPDISTLANVTNVDGMFASANNSNQSFNQPIGNWNVSGISVFSSMFYRARFNQNIGAWNTITGTLMNNMFNSCNFNNGGVATLTNWNTSNVTNMSGMFTLNDAINQSLNTWDVSKVTNMNSIFYHADAWNGNISSWNTLLVTDFTQAFRKCISFNQNISGWNVSSATQMSQMFNSTPFNQNLGAWNVSNVVNMSLFSPNNGGGGTSPFSSANIDAIYAGWASRAVQPNVQLSFGTRPYTAAGAAGRATLVGTPNNWIITDGGQI